MIREIVKDEFFLSQKTDPATKDDIAVGDDLTETLKAYAHICVGLAANMIGERKRIIAVKVEEMYLVMFNPEIVKKSAKEYKVKEGCLSLDGEREAVRYDWIEVKYRDRAFKKERKKFYGFTAQIIQHEIDHLNGILI